MNQCKYGSHESVCLCEQCCSGPIPDISNQINILGCTGYETFSINGNIIKVSPMWNSIKDKLPPEAGFYLVVANWMGVVEKGEFNGKDKWHLNHTFEPTHWMPLPSPPEDK